ncbi:hypothetical protein [Demetria terragena]|uniref:hypothetical protein n=1 Tax=Demetria terragena TaxID=63959 RepID=UPI00037BC094|nr:hypothetical protein [Demetria terragena]
MLPPDDVLDLFAVPGEVRPLPGGQGNSVLAGDLVLSPGRDAVVADLVSPPIARLAVELDTWSGRRRRDLRIAVPVPARNGSWTVNGWGASRYEPGTRACTDLPVIRATGAVLHAELSQAVTEWPLAAAPPSSRWDRAERVAFGEDIPELSEFDDETGEFARALLAIRTPQPVGVQQLVHGDLAGNVLLDEADAPVVIDFAPYWRPVLWADAVCVLDAVMWMDADPSALDDWQTGLHRQAMIRAGIYRLLADEVPDPRPYRKALHFLMRGD